MSELDESLDRFAEMLDHVPDEFHEEGFQPLPHVVKSIEAGRGGDADPEIEQYCSELDSIMEELATLYYQPFNQSIRNFSNILNRLSKSMESVETMKKQIVDSRQLLLLQSSNLNNLYTKSLQYKETIRILELVEEMERGPAQLDVAITTKAWVRAAELIVHMTKALHSQDLLDVVGVQHLRKMIVDKKFTLTEELMEELHNHIYLKVKIAATDDALEYATEQDDTGTITSFNSDTVASRSLSHPAVRASDDGHAATQTSDAEGHHTPRLGGEQAPDTRTSLRSLIEALSILEKMPPTRASLASRLQSELEGLISKASTETETGPGHSGKQRRLVIANKTADKRGRPLQDLVRRLSEYFSSVLSNHLCVMELLAAKNVGISSRHSYTIDDVWGVMQLELQHLLCAYLQYSRSHVVDPRSGQSVEQSSGKREEPQEVEDVPKADLTLFRFSEATSANKQSTSKAAAAALPAPAETGLPMVVPPDAYNITAVYAPMLWLVEDCRRVIAESRFSTSATDQIRVFLDEYILNSFTRRLRGDYTKRAQNVLEGLDMFKCRDRHLRAQYHSDDASRPLLQGVIAFNTMITELSTILAAMPAFLSIFTKLMEDILGDFCNRCESRYEELVGSTKAGQMLKDEDTYADALVMDPLYRDVINARTRAEGSGDEPPRGARRRSDPAVGATAAAAVASRDGATSAGNSDTSRSRKSISAADRERAAFYVAESRAEAELYQSPPELAHLLTDPALLGQLAMLSDSLEWLAQKIDELGYTEEREPEPAARRPGVAAAKLVAATVIKGLRGGRNLFRRHKKRDSGKAPALLTIPPSLEVLAKRFRQLSEKCLFVLRLEFRIHCFHYLSAVKQCTYYFAEKPQEPDFFIVDLNRDLSQNEELMSSCLPPVKTRFLFDGLARLISALLIGSLPHIARINGNGVLKMWRNVFALQQNITNIVASQEAHFDRVRAYYNLLQFENEGMLVQYAKAHATDFSLDEYREVLALLSPNRKPRERSLTILEETCSMARHAQRTSLSAS